jgi:SAM-dependent methyltransferase
MSLMNILSKIDMKNTVKVKCPVCGGSPVYERYQQEREGITYPIAQCTICSVEFVYPPPSPSILYNIQESAFADPDAGCMRASLEYDFWMPECNVIHSLGFHNGRILDVGCNRGGFLEALGVGWEKHGIELVAPLAASARKRGITVYERPVEECQFPDAFFDVITMYALIEHLREPYLVTKQLARMLRPGGLFVVMTGARNSLKARCKGRSWHMYCPPVHLWFFNYNSLSIVVEQAGLRKVFSRYTSGNMPWYIGNTFLAKASDLMERLILKRLFEHPPLWRLPVYDHLYFYAIKA